MPSFTYSSETNRYRDERTGRFIGRVKLRKALDSLIDESADLMKQWTSRLRDSEVNLAWWQTNMANEVKNLQIAFAVAANGGYANMTEEAWQRTQDYIDIQFNYLQNFSNQIYTGRVTLDGRMVNRSSLYAEAGRVTYEAERRIIERNAGATEELNILGGFDHCPGCVNATLSGWVPIGTLEPIGLRQCTARCRCSILYRKGPTDAVGSVIDEDSI